MTTVTCPHCNAANVVGGLYCESCGMALPSPTPSIPRVVSAESLPQTAVGQRLLHEELAVQTKSSSTTLLVVAIIQFAATLLIGMLAYNVGRGRLPTQVFVTLGMLAGVGVMFLALYGWARVSPLPPLIVGLVLYCTLVAINVIASVSQLSADGTRQPGNGIGGLGIGWLDIIIIAVLANGITACLKQRKVLAAAGAPG